MRAQLAVLASTVAVLAFVGRESTACERCRRAECRAAATCTLNPSSTNTASTSMAGCVSESTCQTATGCASGTGDKIRIVIHCPDDTVVTINHRVTQSIGTCREFVSSASDDTPHFYRITACRLVDKDAPSAPHKRFEGDFYLARNGGTLKIFFDPSDKDKTLVWLNSQLVCPGEVRSPCPLPRGSAATAFDKAAKGQYLATPVPAAAPAQGGEAAAPPAATEAPAPPAEVPAPAPAPKA